MMNNDRIKEIQSLIKSTSPGGWSACTANDNSCKCGLIWDRAIDVPIARAYDDEKDYDVSSYQTANMHFIAQSKQIVPELLAEIERLNQLLDHSEK